MYNAAGRPTATILWADPAIIESKLYMIRCQSKLEALYLMTIINSDETWQATIPLATKNWAGNSRDIHKHLWKIPIPEFDEEIPMHQDLAHLGQRLAEEAKVVWIETQAARSASRKSTSVTIARRVLREWQAESPIAQQAEQIVAQLIR